MNLYVELAVTARLLILVQSLMVSHRPGTRVNLTETQRALDRIVTRRNRNRRRAIRRRERVRARITDVVSTP
ncbi:hypothetical protein ASPTUDRAFT_43152 [Aspergillus tubingensis CBS 134.48]|uniref:Secreted protein n=1 Tax=Aspergillus tubingensis (strain CBS 134.48) TaxID=767770 RepID=A0A1L9N4F8_ASPTC|nr:hypothetical protein ASPTUDRAFT_43152 [Aspergillus tubingensis CBS 134.48]